MDCSINVMKTKALIRCTLTAQLIYAFVFTYGKSRFSHDAAHFQEPLQDTLSFQTEY